MVKFSQKLKSPRFLQKKFSWKRITAQGEKAGHIPPLLHAGAGEAEMALTAKNSPEVIGVYGPL